MTERTEEATPKRLRRARAEGDSGASGELSRSVALLVLVFAFPSFVRTLGLTSTQRIQAGIGQAAEELPEVRIDWSGFVREVSTLAVLPVLLAAVVYASAMLVQTGGGFAVGRLRWDLARLNPASGLRDLLSAPRAFAVVRALIGAALVLWIGCVSLRTHLGSIVHSSGRVATVLPVAAEIAQTTARAAAMVGLGLAVIDFVIGKATYKRRLRMSKDEIRREHREAEGDPELKAARERAHREVLHAFSVDAVRSAAVVVVNPTHLACALRYDEEIGDDAPVVVSNGEGDLARQIVRAARDFGVPIVHDQPLARALHELDVGEAIPELLYEAVAEILRDAMEHSRDSQSAQGSS